ncbi:hypothetical protein ASG47_06490 [Devosia sp. Leaf420]|uniref:DUF2125 domain-containing protein n=1 Tax=Devosia sp. Leaf420 TaxID=1736374 RepID=UPI00071344A9|nr:DUF2125 domain-containing protein [Devosia sp. Leaf420]KQT48026.1 hypothetical protein ASG47_06490 [Devosia sp. Leaf420]
MKNRIIALGAVILLVIAAVTGAWYYFAGQLRQQIELLAYADGETSPRLTCANLGVSGFPFAFDVDCTDAVVTTGDVMIKVPGLRASAMVYELNHFLGSAKGPAEISDAFTGQRSAVSWTALEGSLRLTDNRIARLSLIGDDIGWNDLLLGDTLLARTKHAEFHLLDMPEAHNAERNLSALALYMRADALELPAATLTNTAVEVEAELTGIPDDYSTIGLTPVLPTWQQAGGELKIVSVKMTDDTADLNASGNLALGPTGLVDGTINIDSQGVAERIGPMIEEPWRTLVLGVPGADGRHTNQLNFRAGTLSSGLLPITTLPPLF